MRNRHALNEAFQDNLLRTLFHINKDEHINFEGKKEPALSPDGAKFALSFPLDWDRLTGRNLSFYVDNDFARFIPGQNGSLHGKSTADLSHTEEAKKKMERKAVDSYSKNADDANKKVKIIGDAKSDVTALKESLPRAEYERRDVCEVVSEFLKLVRDGKENRFISKEEHDILIDWKKILGPSLLNSLKETTIELVDSLFKDYVSDVPETNKGKLKYKVKAGVHYEKALDQDYLGQYDNISELTMVPVEDFMKEVKSNKLFDAYSLEALDKAKAKCAKDENVSTDNLKYLRNKKIIQYYLGIRTGQFRGEKADLTYVNKKESTDGEWTSKKTAEEVQTLKRIYNSVKNSDKVKSSSEVYKLFVNILSRADVMKDSAKGKMHDAVARIVSDKADETRIAETGDFAVALFLGANLQIKYVISSVYVDLMNYNLIGTYDLPSNGNPKNRKYVYGWKEGKKLSTLADAAKLKIDSLLNFKGEEKSKTFAEAVNLNQIPIKEIIDNTSVHCALVIDGVLDKNIVDGDDELSVNKFILNNLGGVDLDIKPFKSTGGRKWKIEGKDEGTSLSSIEDALKSKGVEYEQKVIKGKKVLVVGQNYSNELMDIAKKSHIDTFVMNRSFDALDELREDYNIFMDNFISNEDFAVRYIDLFNRIYKENLMDRKVSNAVKTIVNITHIYDIIKEMRDYNDIVLMNGKSVSDSYIDKVRTLTDVKIADELSKKSLPVSFSPVSFVLRTRITHVLDRINGMLDQNNIAVRLEGMENINYSTLGQMVRSHATKVRNRYMNAPYLSDREKEQKLKGVADFDKDKEKYDNSEASSRLHNRIRELLDEYKSYGFRVRNSRNSGGKSDTSDFGTELIRLANPKFVKAEKIRKTFNDVVSQAILEIDTNVSDGDVKIDALRDVMAYIRNNINILKRIDKYVGDVDNEKSLKDPSNGKIEGLRRCLDLMLNSTRSFKSDMRSDYGISITASGPGE